jgi:hypothetical protein
MFFAVRLEVACGTNRRDIIGSWCLTYYIRIYNEGQESVHISVMIARLHIETLGRLSMKREC